MFFTVVWKFQIATDKVGKTAKTHTIKVKREAE